MADHSTVSTSALRPNQPPRQVIATFDNYDDAERAVDHLSDQHFPIHKVAIVGRNLEFVEQVTGRMNWGWAALRGAGPGALVGALIGWVFGAFSWIEPLIAMLLLALYGVVFGAVIGALMGLFLYALQRGRRDFSAVAGLIPKQYDVVADVDVADQAVRLLAGTSNRKAS